MEEVLGLIDACVSAATSGKRQQPATGGPLGSVTASRAGVDVGERVGGLQALYLSLDCSEVCNKSTQAQCTLVNRRSWVSIACVR